MKSESENVKKCPAAATGVSCARPVAVAGHI